MAIAAGYSGLRQLAVKGNEAYLALALPLTQATEVLIPAGATMAAVGDLLADAGVVSEPRRFIAAARHRQADRSIKAGLYLIEPEATHEQLLDKLVKGEVIVEWFTIIEGMTFAEVLASLASQPHVEHEIMPLPADQAWRAIAPASGTGPEGMLLPDTYQYNRGETDLAILARAHAQLLAELEREWARRDPAVPLESPYEALILASVIEKETGTADERDLVASVFANRLRIGMPLQSDPTVIYSLGEKFDGNLRRVDLRYDAPHNTYVYRGLPPSPIAMPGIAAIRAALHPRESDYLYFVADGSGGHYFSKSLREHNNAVNRYQRKRK